uniref:Ciliary neurotrophic factor n=1 Tax=Gasterosteus aculeatus aculeatus TaxID=481459 RepID=A0AAQ4P9I4_GASAC|nr:ciliary neurotrophic factor-like [Gasterosteus aculeatus aculeatus]
MSGKHARRARDGRARASRRDGPTLRSSPVDAPAAPTTAAGRPSRAAVARASAIAELLRYECSVLLELYTKKENFTPDVADSHLVSVPPPSSQLDASDELRRLHSALLQCRSLLESTIAREEEELGGGKADDYETQRKMVKDRLSLLLISTGELLQAAGGAGVPPPGVEGSKSDGSSGLFQLKLWVYRIFKELEYWTKTAVTTLQALLSVTGKERARTPRGRSLRRVRQ